MKKIFIILLFLIYFGFIYSPVFAQTKLGFSVSPPSFELSVNPGDTISNTVRIENLNPEMIKIKAIPRSFVTYGEGGQVAINSEESSFSIINWLQMEKSEIEIRPNSFGIFNFKLNVPKNAEPGSHYGAIVFSTVNDGKNMGSGAYVSQEIGSLILVKLPGDIYEKVDLLNFTMQENPVRNDDLKFSAHLENTGNIHVKPYGYIAIYNLIGQKVKTVEVLGRNILPGSKRIFEETVKFNGFGLYNAELTLLYSGGGKLIHGKTTFVILNLKRSSPFLIVFAVLMVFILLFRKRLRKAMKILLKG
jgi:hypothetical protein